MKRSSNRTGQMVEYGNTLEVEANRPLSDMDDGTITTQMLMANNQRMATI